MLPSEFGSPVSQLRQVVLNGRKRPPVRFPGQHARHIIAPPQVHRVVLAAPRVGKQQHARRANDLAGQKVRPQPVRAAADDPRAAALALKRGLPRARPAENHKAAAVADFQIEIREELVRRPSGIAEEARRFLGKLPFIGRVAVHMVAQNALQNRVCPGEEQVQRVHVRDHGTFRLAAVLKIHRPRQRAEGLIPFQKQPRGQGLFAAQFKTNLRLIHAVRARLVLRAAPEGLRFKPLPRAPVQREPHGQLLRV